VPRFYDALGIVNPSALELYTLANPVHGSQTFTSNGTFTVPAYVTEITVVEVGGGGGGCEYGASICTNGMPGQVTTVQLAVTPGEQFSVTIGSGGTGGANSSPGNAGGTTSFGSYNAAGGDGAFQPNFGNTTLLNTPLGNGTGYGDGGASNQSSAGNTGSNGAVIVYW